MSSNNAVVYKSNALVEASYRLSVAEQRIILACIDQVRRDGSVTDEVMYSIRAAEIAELSGTDPKQAYAELEKAALRLKRREVWLSHTPEGKKHHETMITGWVQTIVYRKDKGMVDLRFSKDMLPYLTELKGHFTRYALSDVAQMTSSYAIRLYELLIERMDFGERSVEVEWLRRTLQLEGKYPAIKDFKRWVIEPAVEQINEHSPIHVKWSQSKTGRRVTHLHFKFQARSLPNKQKVVKAEKQAAEKGTDRDPQGSTYGIKNADIMAAKQDGEDFMDAAYRIMFERKQKALF